MITDKTCEQCKWSDDSERLPGQSAIRLLCSNPTVMRDAREQEPVWVLSARLSYCRPDERGGPHWEPKIRRSSTRAALEGK
jgi:hypothetical protein